MLNFFIILVMLFIVWKAFKWAYKGTRTGCTFGVHDPDFSKITRSGYYTEKTLCRVCTTDMERDA